MAEVTDSIALDMVDAMSTWRESGDDDHFYGAWTGGSKASGGHPTKSAPKDPAAAVKAAVESHGVRLAKGTQEYETGVLIGPDGKVVFEQKGTGRDEQKGGAGAVDLTPEPNRLLKGGHLVHNHPSGTGLSPGDMAVAARYDLVSMHAYGTNDIGQRVHSAIYRPEGGWPSLWDSRKMTDPFDDLMRSTHRDVLGEFGARINRERAAGMSAYEEAVKKANRSHSSEVARRVARAIGARYEETTW